MDSGAASGARRAVPRVLVTGGAGQLGRWLRARASAALDVRAPGRGELDLSCSESVAAALESHAPDVVLNAAAFTAVDAAEEHPAAAEAANVDGAARLAAACAERGIGLAHVSTDYVPGLHGVLADAATRPALRALPPEDLPSAPPGVYADTKWRGELAVRAAHPAAVVVRTAWVYTGPARAALGLGGSDFVATMLRLERDHETITVVDDQWGSPTYAADLAGGLLTLAARLAEPEPAVRGTVLHLAGAGRATWHELAAEVFALAGADPARVHPVTTAEFPRPAPRPSFSVLSGREWTHEGLAPAPHWRDALRRAFRAAR